MSKSRSGRRSFHPANSPPGGGGGVSTPQTARFFLKKKSRGAWNRDRSGRWFLGLRGT